MIVTAPHPQPGAMGESMSRIQAEDRHRKIIQMVQQRGYVSNEELARTFGVTAQPVRSVMRGFALQAPTCNS